MKKLNVNMLLNGLIEDGKFCSVQFIKKDGSLGYVHGRTGVKKHTHGGARVSSPSEYIMFWDKVKGYRNIARNRIVSVNGHHLKIKHV